MVRRVNHLYYAIGLIAAFYIIGGTYAAAFFWPRNVNYSYSGPTCSNVPTFFPGLHKVESSENYKLHFENQRSVAGFPVVASKSCVTLTNPAASVNTQKLKVMIFGSLIGRQFSVTTPPAPALAATTAPQSLIAVTEKLSYTLDQSDATFNYSLLAGDKTSACTTDKTIVSCPVTPLQLNQGQRYQLSLQRQFKGRPLDTLTKYSVTTVEPIALSASSISAGATVYDDPKTLTLTFNKPIDNPGTLTLRTGSNDITHSTQLKGSQLIISFTSPLPRNAKIDLVISETTATDKGYLVEPYVSSFTTSGGPKVTSVNIGASRITANPTIILTFDSSVKAEVASQFITATPMGIGTLSISGNRATLRLARPLAPCEAVTIHISDKLQNVYGISGNNAWTFSSRASCGSSFTIGTSVEGRAITAWQFGSGNSTILYIGATHGSELSSKIILDSWISYLDTNAYKLPANRKIIVIAAVNPDGVAHNNRLNAHGVDLNRNFPASSWKANVTVPGGQLVTNGGGTAPLSEPESAALANFTQSLKPRLVLTYHSKASLITANESGDSMSLANTYARSTGYNAVAESRLGNTFNYDTTGAYENWTHEKLDIPTLLIELPGHTANYFNSNLTALWAMANI